MSLSMTKHDIWRTLERLKGVTQWRYLYLKPKADLDWIQSQQVIARNRDNAHAVLRKQRDWKHSPPSPVSGLVPWERARVIKEKLETFI